MMMFSYRHEAYCSTHGLWGKNMYGTLCNLIFHPKGFEQFQHHLLIHLRLSSILLHTQDLGSLSPWKGRNLVNKIAFSLVSLSNSDGNENDDNDDVVNDDGNKVKQNNKFAHASHFFVHFFAIAAQLRLEISRFMEDINKQWQIFFLFLNLSVVPKKSTPRKFAYIRHFQQIGIKFNVMKFEKR